jgi:aspartate/methionine/tyrosine aminotransferase/GNAT superfamily N-acetyltransferase
VNLSIRLCSSDSEATTCARMMAGTAPWKILFFSEAQCRENLLSASLELHVADVSGQLAGFVATRAEGIEGEPLLEYICVDSAYRNCGIGTRMLQFVEEELFPRADNLYLFVSDINPRAIALYERAGYVRVGELPDYNLFAQTEYLYRKSRRPRQERFRPTAHVANLVALPRVVPKGLSLTAQQNEGESRNAFDLASGYARLPLPQALGEVVVEGVRAALGRRPLELAKDRLRDSVGELLEMPPHVRDRIRSTFSGSIALDRVFAAVRKHLYSFGRGGMIAILAEPSIDLSYHLLTEHHDVRIVGVRQQAPSESPVGLLMEALKSVCSRTRGRSVMVVLDSPSNPTGIVTSERDLEQIAAACGQVGAVLVVDHCFLLAGLHAPRRLPNVFCLSSDICDWIGIWDTGKSIDMSGDKMGFIVPGNQRMATAINEALDVIQPTSSNERRAIEVFSRVFEAPELRSYLAEGGRSCCSNLGYLQSRVRNGWSVPTPASGTFACVHFPDSLKGSDEIREEWMVAGVSTVAGRAFLSATSDFHGEGAPFLRVSLLREPELFRAAISRIP